MEAKPRMQSKVSINLHSDYGAASRGGGILSTEQTVDLVRLFSADLVQCPRLTREEENRLTRRTHAAWRQLLTVLQEQRSLLATLLETPTARMEEEHMSEPRALCYLHAVQVYMRQGNHPESAAQRIVLQIWLDTVNEKLTCFRLYRDEMVRRNLRLIAMLAQRHQHRRVSFLDLVQEGVLGLMRAVEKFDPDRDVTFASYAVWWIRQAFSHALESREENVCSADAPLKEGEDGSLADLIAAPEETSPEIAVLTADTARGLHRALTCLPVQEADILRLRFGLSGGRTHTLEEVGQQLSLTREQVRLREQRALARLKHHLQPTRARLHARPNAAPLRSSVKTSSQRGQNASKEWRTAS